MRRVFFALLALSGASTFTGISACSLLVSTDGYDGPPLADAGNSAETSGNEASTEAGPDGVDGGALEPIGCPNRHGHAADAPWPTAGGCPSHVGRSALVGPQTSDKSFDFTVPVGETFGNNKTYAQPVIDADGNLFFGVEEPNVGVQGWTSTGTLLWKADQGSASGLALGAGGTLIANDSQGMASINRLTGAHTWKWGPSGGEVDSPIVIGLGGTIFFGGYDGNVYGITSAGGNRWSVPIGGIVGGPAIGPSQLVYAGSTNGPLTCLNVDGIVLWTYPFAGGTTTPAIDSDENIYFGTITTSVVFAIDKTGKLKWSNEIGLGELGTPSIARDRTIYITTKMGPMVALDGATGNTKWTKPFPAATYYHQPAIDAEGTIYVATSEPAVHALRPDGSTKWVSVLPETPSHGAVIGANGAIVVLMSQGKVRVIQP